MKPTSDGSITIGDEQESQFPTEDDELAGTEDEHTVIVAKDKVIASYQAVKDVLEQKQWKVFTWPNSKVELLMDATTAHVLVTIHDNLVDDGNREKIERMIAASPNGLDKVIKLAWQVVK